MTLITYVPSSNYPNIQGATVQYRNGQSFDIKAALVAGAGQFTVDSITADPSLISALDSSPAVVRSGVTPGTPQPLDRYGPVLAHQVNPRVGEILVRGADLSFGTHPNFLLDPSDLGTPADTATLMYQATTGLMGFGIPATAGREIAYAENISGVAQTIAGTAGGNVFLDVTNCAITVPPNTGIVYVEAGIYFFQSVAGQGQASTVLYDTTGGGSVSVAQDTRFLPNATPTNDRVVGYVRARARLGAVGSTRTFKSAGLLQAAPANTPSVVMYNTSPVGSYIRAWAE